MDYGEQNFRWAAALLEGLCDGGVQHIVVSPGSRSTPLVLACLQRSDLRAWVLPDERSAAFFALGIGKRGAAPAAVIGTSGSAPANWYPAVIEAAYDLRPLLLISADRPLELQDCGANQTIDQARLFGSHVRGFFPLPEANASDGGLRQARGLARRAADRSRWPVPGPVHINVPLHEPLVPGGVLPIVPPRQDLGVDVGYPILTPRASDVASLAATLGAGRGLIVCGREPGARGFAGAVTRLAKHLNCPILADPLSGLRFGDHDRTLVSTYYDAFLRRDRFVRDHSPDWVLRFGGVPTSKVLQAYLDSVALGGTTLVVPHGPWPDPGQRSRRVLHVDPAVLCDELARQGIPPAPEEWTAAFVDAERRAASLLKGAPRVPPEAAMMTILARSCPSGTSMFLGNSMVIRDADAFLAGGPQDLFLIGNRGASGIDGNVSTALGIAASAEGPVLGVLGDLALYHDMNGLLVASDLNVTLVVVNNGGGGIFSYLPQARLPEFERYWLTPTGLDLGQVARLYGLGHRRAADPARFETALIESLGSTGVQLIEFVVDRSESVASHRDYWAAVET